MRNQLPRKTLTTRSVWILICLLISVLLASSSPATEPAKPAAATTPLSHLQGVQLWLDATAEASSRGLPDDSKQEVPVDQWSDRSGNSRHFLQRSAEKQPRLVNVAGRWLVRFSGHGQHMRCPEARLRLTNATIWLMVRPAANLGGFSAFFAANRQGANDYETAFTIDMGPSSSLQFDVLNVEGRGFGGAHDLLGPVLPLRHLYLIEILLSADEKKIEVLIDGQPTGQRAWKPAMLEIDAMTLGARFYSNGPVPPQVRGFLAGDVAEVVVFNRVLDTAQRDQLRRYFNHKYANTREVFSKQASEKTENSIGSKQTVAQPPEVQMLVPGFDVYALPVQLPNINNVRYRDDGTLVALAYNGNIYLLRDRDNDGLEEHVELFWENRGRLVSPIGMALTPPDYHHGRGAFVASKGKLSLIVDTNGDDRADREIVVASGWQPLAHNVDALGVALDKQGNIYFGLGTANFANPYLLDDKAQAHYDTSQVHGTIQKVTPDFQTRETVCSGIRFPVGLAFNHRGHLFCTDQEGATWLANGNPFDELLWIRPKRHYGFPPRHPRHLPHVVDEPSVYDYGPQHQSTCGLIFNDPPPGQPPFGPAWWRGDALVCGESRGKLYRTKLAYTAHGYVATTQIIGRLARLTIDACLAPGGRLVVATHSGLPDWGTGPQGEGKLFKIVPTNPAPPRPVLAYSAGPQQIHVVFDRPLDPARLRQVGRSVRVIYGRYVRAGERFEVLTPPYEVVQHQLLSNRFRLPVHSVQLSHDRHTLILHTEPHTQAVHYAVTLAGLGQPVRPANAIEQENTIDVDFELSGATLTVTDADRVPLWSGWLPHLDSAAAKQLTTGSPIHARLWQLRAERSTWELNAQLRLDHLLRPRVQIGSKLDYEPSPEEVTVRFTANCPIEIDFGGPVLRKQIGRGAPSHAPATNATQSHTRENTRTQPKPWWAEFTVRTRAATLWPVAIRLRPQTGPPQLAVACYTAEDPRLRPLATHRIVLPWATIGGAAAAKPFVRSSHEKLKHASWGRGRRIFFGNKVGCWKCHRVRGQGGAIGPDLSNLVHRDYHSVRRDILKPSYAINPDYVSYTVVLDDGRVLTGPLRSQGDLMVVGTSQAEEVRIPRSSIEEMQASPISVMPDDLGKRLTPDELDDLLAFLLLPPPHMPLVDQPAPPPSRPRREVLRFVPPPSAAPASEPLEKIKIVLVAGPKDHGPNEHDYPAWQKAWAELFRSAPATEVVTRWQWPTEEDYQTADVIVFYKQLVYQREQGPWMDRLLARNKGMVFIHWAVHGGEAPDELAQRIGLAAGKIRFRHGELLLRVPPSARRHPIMREFDTLRLVDESYWELVGQPSRLTVLATSNEDHQPQPQIWSIDHAPGRVFVCIPGHYSWTFDDPLYRILLLRGIAWAAGQPTDRFIQLAWPGARIDTQ